MAANPHPDKIMYATTGPLFDDMFKHPDSYLHYVRSDATDHAEAPGLPVLVGGVDLTLDKPTRNGDMPRLIATTYVDQEHKNSRPITHAIVEGYSSFYQDLRRAPRMPGIGLLLSDCEVSLLGNAIQDTRRHGRTVLAAYMLCEQGKDSGVFQRELYYPRALARRAQAAATEAGLISRARAAQNSLRSRILHPKRKALPLDMYGQVIAEHIVAKLLLPGPDSLTQSLVSLQDGGRGRVGQTRARPPQTKRVFNTGGVPARRPR